MSSTTQPTILITGATDGIGLALARIYQERGARLILVGRRSLDRLDGALFSPSSYCQADLSHDDSAEKIARFLYREGIEQLDLLIHNAGLGFYGASETQSLKSVRELVAVN
ncbi:MAG: SDR family NAD(P)-dependent oxidoreductase, partial [Ardenticatenaceae bacterium]